MKDGFLVLDKPLGRTSSDCVVFIRRRLPRGTAVGHGGTLDPMASGVLPICVGAATRLFDYIIDKQKTYVAELRLGVTTDTQDATGAVLETSTARVTADALRAALPRFTGEIYQTPPMYSAIKRNGKRLYELARQGQSVDVAPRACRVDGLRLKQALGDNRFVLEIDCGKGVYIRTLCHDIGQFLGCGGHMAALRRTRAGAFTLERAMTLEQIADMDARGLESHFMPMDEAIAHLPAVRVSGAHREAARNGMPLRAQWLDAPAPEAQAVRVYVGDSFAGVGAPQEDGSVRFRAMLLK